MKTKRKKALIPKVFSKNFQLSTLINPALQAFLPRGSEKINKFNFSLAPQRQLSTFFAIFAHKRKIEQKL